MTDYLQNSKKRTRSQSLKGLVSYESELTNAMVDYPRGHVARKIADTKYLPPLSGTTMVTIQFQIQLFIMNVSLKARALMKNQSPLRQDGRISAAKRQNQNLSG